MDRQLPEILNVLIINRVTDAVLDRVRNVAPGRLNVIPAWGDFVPEMEAEWPEGMVGRFGSGSSATTRRTPEEVEAMVRDAHVVMLGVTFPKTLPGRATSLLWAHFGFAGVSNLKDTGWWQAGPFPISSSRGYVAATPIAESVIAGAFMLAKRLDYAVDAGRRGVFDSREYPQTRVVGGKTMGIVGLGGIGSHVARLARGVGMRVIATRRSASTRQQDVDGVDEVFPASQLHEMLVEADFVAVCAMWTDETERMIDGAAFEAMKPGAFLLNIARGEIIDEAAMVEALHSGKLGGAYLDVWDDDMARPPSPALAAAPNVIFTPHVSARGDVSHMFQIDVFCENLGRLLRGEPLQNVVDWQRGY